MKNRVCESLHNADASLCVDVFVRPDGTFGYEEYRRDFEDGGGWFSLQKYAFQRFDSQADALSQAKLSLEWLVNT